MQQKKGGGATYLLHRPSKHLILHLELPDERCRCNDRFCERYRRSNVTIFVLWGKAIDRRGDGSNVTKEGLEGDEERCWRLRSGRGIDDHCR